MAAPDDLNVAPGIDIPRAELSYRASRAGGAGGQHVNTSSTRVEVLWNVRTTNAMAPEVRDRVALKLAGRVDGEGVVRVVSSERRSQSQNREAGEERLAALVRAALVVPRKRRATKPTKASKEKRLDSKKKRSTTKSQRRDSSFD